MEEVVVSGLVLNADEAKVTVRAVRDEPGVASRIFEPLAARHINVDMIVQNVGEAGATDVTFTVAKSDLAAAVEVAEKLVASGVARGVAADERIAKLSAVGLGMRTHAGVAAKMFATLAAEKVNIQMISTSEIKISVVISDDDGPRALRALHRAFGLGKAPAAKTKAKGKGRKS